MKRRGNFLRSSFGAGLFLSVMVVVLAVAVGYAGTKYIVYPYMLGGKDVQETAKREAGQKATGSGVVIGEQKVTELTPGVINPPTAGTDSGIKTGVPSGSALQGSAEEKAADAAVQPAAAPAQVSLTLYSLQFGSFSTQEAALTEQTTLKGLGLSTYIWSKDSHFKVMGMPYLNKDQAKVAAGILKPSVNDVYVSTADINFPDEKQRETLKGLLNSYTTVEQSQDANKASVLSGLQEPIITIMEGLIK